MRAVNSLIGAGILLASASIAQAHTPEPPTPITIALSNFKFDPGAINLHHGQSYILTLANKVGGSHDFAAPRFFQSVTLDPRDRAAVTHGVVDMPGEKIVQLHLTAPAPGTYEFHCSHFMHSSFGMKGNFVVD